ncbi:MAG: methyltransferase domain-containing protein [Oscillospiraceae bacterium]
MYICPVCRTRMKENKKGFCCKKGHRFDYAAQGYVNLLTSSHRNPKTSGDNAMMVKARTDFLERDYYRPLAEKAAQTMKTLLEGVSSPVVLDCGCGEGYYTNIYAQSLPDAQVFGFDLSKSAVRHASSQASQKGIKNVHFAAASCFELPIADRAADLIVCTFAPVSNDEYARVLKKGGKLVIICPSPIHLSGLKAALYDDPYLNKPNEYGLKSFAPLDPQRLEYEITLETNEDIMNLFAMTPYYYKTSEEGKKRLSALDSLKTDCGFDILSFRKK